MDVLKLPLADPPIKGLLRWPYTLSITHQHEKTWPWFYCNFIQLWSTQDFMEGRELFFDFFRGNNNELYYNNPFLLACALNFDTMSFLNEGNLIDYFTEQMCCGYYPVVFIDESRISYSPVHGGAPFPHHLMLYGFHRQDRMFDVGMYDKRWMYGMTRVSFEEFVEAFFSMKKETKGTSAVYERTFLYKFNEVAEFAFDKTAVINEIRDYLNCETGLNRINFNPPPEVYGLEVYRCLSGYYQALKDKYPSLNMRGVTRHLNTLGEHKRGIIERIRYYVRIGAMKSDDALLNGFEDLAKRAEIMRLLLLKYYLTADGQHLAKIIEELHRFRPEDQRLMEQLLADLQA